MKTLLSFFFIFGMWVFKSIIIFYKHTSMRYYTIRRPCFLQRNDVYEKFLNEFTSRTQRPRLISWCGLFSRRPFKSFTNAFPETHRRQWHETRTEPFWHHHRTFSSRAKEHVSNHRLRSCLWRRIHHASPQILQWLEVCSSTRTHRHHETHRFSARFTWSPNAHPWYSWYTIHPDILLQWI